MYNTEKITFRCKVGKGTLYTPEFMHDVLAMRSHPEYEEVKQDADGAVTRVVTQPEELVQRPLVAVQSPVLGAPKPVARKQGGKRK